MAAKPNTMNGGFWNSPQAQYSPQTQKLLKEMMNESKLTNFQQRHLEKSLRSGSSLPSECNPTSSARPRVVKQTKKPSKILNPKNYTGGVRSKDTMEALGAFEKPEYSLPKNNARSAREKERLANMMAFGKDVDNIQKQKVQVPVEIEEPVEIDRFDELQLEVEERQKFLADMTKLGKGRDYKHIETEISQLVREMEVIDKKRTKQLDSLLKTYDGES
ncbi:hypothetical protein LOTGIDRAFT_230313 [Lottia gigantea]|uniref:Uncharacterized protein n=1 Tax=Lottia gigantea TaxID=225164 RepID=V4B1A0_LOTGI|nr:hypothetical protein LOTGIDRAFT_230313 [Lottia gigantea]ESP04068.1 hypothetical protein LOTGIDRAFT_230313 [Lottia gigantea]